MKLLTDEMIAEQAAADAAAALHEDLGDGDLSAALSAGGMLRGKLICRQQAVLCGQLWFEACFSQLDAAVRFCWHCKDGDAMQANTVVCEVQARGDALLSGERAALNFLQTLSATASTARRWQSLAGDVLLVDTRKTIPKLRIAQKYAVRVGGAHNHRMGLFDEILIKENHIVAAGGIAAALAAAKKQASPQDIQIEVQNISEAAAAIAAGAKRILLDNFLPQDIAAAVQLGAAAGDIEWEASGNIDENNLSEYTGTGVHRISCGGLTKNIQAIDFSFVVKS